MKKITLLLVAGNLMFCTLFMHAQNQSSIDNQVEHDNISYSQKGKFHIALQDFSFGVTVGTFSLSSLSLRAGYSFTHKDMVFLSGRYTFNPREGYSDAVETGLFYRRYFTNGNFQPFIQLGGGLGYIEFSEEDGDLQDHKFYGSMNVGTGVSFRYKRWGFELGIQSGFNQYSTGRLTLLPIVGISFSF